jgi:hypothetical protein
MPQGEPSRFEPTPRASDLTDGLDPHEGLATTSPISNASLSGGWCRVAFQASQFWCCCSSRKRLTNRLHVPLPLDLRRAHLRSIKQHPNDPRTNSI